MTFEESVRKRPGMYIGNDGIVGLVIGLLNDCIEFSKTDKIVFEIAIGGDNDFYIGISSDQDLGEFLKLFTIDADKENIFFIFAQRHGLYINVGSHLRSG